MPPAADVIAQRRARLRELTGRRAIDFSAETLAFSQQAVADGACAPAILPQVMLDLAVLLNNARDTESAATLAEQLLARSRDLAKPEDVALAVSLVGGAHLAAGRIAEAVSWLGEAVRLYAEAPEASTGARAAMNHSFAQALFAAGDHLRARVLLEEAQTLLAGSARDEPELRFEILCLLAEIRGMLGDPVAAMQTLQEAEDALSLDEERAFRLQDRRARTLDRAGLPAEAAEQLRTLHASQERAYGPGDPRTSSTENHLARVLVTLGALDEAERFADAAMATRRRTFGDDSIEVAGVLATLSNIAAVRGDHARSIDLAERRLALQRRHLPPEHPEISDSAWRVAVMQALLGEHAAARRDLAALVREDVTRVMTMAASGEAERMDAVYARRGERDLLVTLARAASDGATVLETLINAKGLATGLSARRTAAAQRSPELDVAVSRVASVAVRGAQGRAMDDYLSVSSHYFERLSREQVREDRLASTTDSAWTTVDDLRSQVPDGTALVDISRSADADLDATTPSEIVGGGRDCYIGSVLSRDGVELVVRLGDTAAIDSLVREFRQEMALYAALPALPAVTAAAERQIGERCRALYDATLAPLAPALANREHLVLSLDGAVSLVPFACLTDRRGRSALERWTITYLSSVDDLFVPPAAAPTTELVVLADPDYGEPDISAHGERPADGWTPFSDALRTTWVRLPGTARELEAVAAALGPGRIRRLVGREASKGKLTRLRRPALLHLATHAFYVPESRLAVVHDGPTLHGSQALRAGLVLEGANARRGLLYSAPDDGIMTALELSRLDLSATRLVVLSACETAVGETLTGDSVHGLRRACHVAGARNVLSCLWSVSDDDSAAVMHDVYVLAADGVPPAVALRRAMLKRRQAHPHHWAAWVMSGDVGAAMTPFPELGPGERASVEGRSATV